ncbi:MAG: DHH family phosphoesterase [Solirubrobacteraceae bacterium]|nr:DHH family phosphoesterase [Solirubrobacteraceae bacterium]
MATVTSPDSATPLTPPAPVGPADGEPRAEVHPAADPRPVAAAVDAAALRELMGALSVGHVTAQALLRRGLSDPAEASRWLGGRADAATELPGLDAAVALVLHHVQAGSRILIHGDYDVDGVCASAILLDTLELLGSRAAWHLPKRGVDGYGLTAASLERIGRLGAELVITVDCGITAVDESRQLREAGVDVLITDHHLARDDGQLPPVTILHPAVRGGELVEPATAPCGAGVAAHLARALLAEAGQSAAALQDGIAELTALATIADCVPLTGENRQLVRDGLAALARTRRPGLRALLRSARVDAATLDGQAVGFRLAPRLNAAGRVARADLALALLRTGSDEEAARLVEEIERCNLRRREAELEVRRAAEQQVRALGPRSGYVLAGEGWPAGVVGITASRIAEDTDRPTVVVGMNGEIGSGSARSARGLDLAALLGECRGELEKFGGHAAAAGCEVRAEKLEAFAAAFDAAAARALESAAETPPPSVDAVAEVRDLTLDLAEELAAFEPTGEGNPAVRLLLPSVRVIEESPMGSGNEHRRAVIASGGARTNAVAFSSPPIPMGVPLDLVVHLERSSYGGTVEARVVVQSVHELERASASSAAGVGRDATALAALLAGYQEPLPASVLPPRPSVDRRGCSVAAALRVAAACGREPIAYVADTGRRAPQLRALGFTGTIAGPAALPRALAVADPDRSLVICVDPPLDPRAAAALASTDVEAWWSWTEAELTYSLHVLEREFALRPLMVALYRGLRDAGAPLHALGLLALLPEGHAPAGLGRAVRVLEDLGLVTVGEALGSVELISQERAELERSAIFTQSAALVEEARAWSLSPQSA